MGGGDVTGRKLYELESATSKKLDEYHVVGVVKDFNFNSLRQVVTPVGLFLREDRGSIALRIGNGKDASRILAQAEQAWQKIANGQEFSYVFMDDQFNNIYKSEQRMGGISLSFSLLAIFIACLGLFGLAAYAAEQRTREIGIRKVLGASVSGIVTLLSKDFLRLVLVAAILAFPLSWWAMHSWLQDFAYRISIGWEVFALAAALAVSIALATVSMQAIKAALANPVKSLRSE
jgi:putative ABC transport system permease protein